MAALGVLLALMLAQRTARIADVVPAQVWNLCVAALFAALVGSRIVLLAINWHDVKEHPLWMLGLATIHHPLLVAAGATLGGLTALVYARWHRLPLLNTADTLAAPITLGIACEQLGALLAGSAFGTDTKVRWAVTYTNPLAARWSGAPLGVPVHPVQAYAAIAFLSLALLLLVILPARRQHGDVAGVALMGAGVTVFVTEFWRDWEGRGALLRGALDGPQVAAIVMVLGGAALLRKRADARAVAQDAAEVSHG
jgi:phosphatidylglycerol---prolipoprotein diacylglyceryl transferase